MSSNRRAGGSGVSIAVSVTRDGRPRTSGSRPNDADVPTARKCCAPTRERPRDFRRRFYRYTRSRVSSKNCASNLSKLRHTRVRTNNRAHGSWQIRLTQHDVLCSDRRTPRAQTQRRTRPPHRERTGFTPNPTPLVTTERTHAQSAGDTPALTHTARALAPINASK